MSTPPIVLTHQDIQGFLVRHDDGTERVIPCQQACLDTPFVHFWSINENRTGEAFLMAVSTASISAITPVYKDGSRCATLIGQGPAA